MRIDRRNFLKLSAGTGLALVAAPLVRNAGAAEPYAGPFYIHLHASGGWDPIYLCDPKSDPELASYPGAGTAGPFSYAGTAIDDLTAIGLDPAVPEVATYLMSNQAFFEKYVSRVRVINGIDTATNNHEIGRRAAGSGHGPEGYPSFGALAASSLGRDKALAYISSGAYDATQGLVATTRLSANSYARMAYPFDSNTTTPGSAPYHTANTEARIRDAQLARMTALGDRAHLPRVKKAIGDLRSARLEDSTLSTLTLPTLVTTPGNQLGDLQGVMQQVQLSMAAFDAGLAVSASIGLGGFDTHANHDRDQTRQLAKLLGAIDFLWETAAQLGLSDQITLMVTGDFGRGPAFNGTNTANRGKDHWPVTSALFMGRGVTPGLIGATDSNHRPTTVNPTTLAPDPSGVRITFTHLHHALRQLAGIQAAPDSSAFPLVGDALPLLG